MEKRKDYSELISIVLLAAFSILLIFKVKRLENQLQLLTKGVQAPRFLKRLNVDFSDPTLIYVIDPSKCIGSILEFKNIVGQKNSIIMPFCDDSLLLYRWIKSMRIKENKIFYDKKFYDFLSFFNDCRFPIKIILFHGKIFYWECGATQNGNYVINALKLLQKEGY